MKKMIVDKNGQLKQLREKLAKYESVDENDDWSNSRIKNINQKKTKSNLD